MEDSEIRKLFVKLGKDVTEIKKQTLVNCNKLTEISKSQHQLKDIGKKNQNSINELIKQNRYIKKHLR